MYGISEEEYLDRLAYYSEGQIAPPPKDDSHMIDALVKAGMFVLVVTKGAAKMLAGRFTKRLDAERALAARTDWDEVDSDGNCLGLRIEPAKSRRR